MYQFFIEYCSSTVFYSIKKLHGNYLMYVNDCGSQLEVSIFTPQLLRAVQVLFSPMVSAWVGGGKNVFSRLYLRYQRF